jgi:hypothetical protein
MPIAYRSVMIKLEDIGDGKRVDSLPLRYLVQGLPSGS